MTLTTSRRIDKCPTRRQNFFHLDRQGDKCLGGKGMLGIDRAVILHSFLKFICWSLQRESDEYIQLGRISWLWIPIQTFDFPAILSWLPSMPSQLWNGLLVKRSLKLIIELNERCTFKRTTIFKVNQCLTLFQNTALRCQCRQEKDLEKFKANYDVRERVAMETRWSNM